MQCDCSYETTDFEPWEFGTVKIRKAVKEHKCCECHDPILPGQEYEYASGRFEGDYLTFRTCKTCLQIRSDYCPRGHIYGGLAEAIRECLEVELKGITEDEL